MATEGKKFSDFQQAECTPPEPTPVVSERDVCPTCTPDPNFKMKKPWFQMTEAWLNKKNCTYNYTFDLRRLKSIDLPVKTTFSHPTVPKISEDDSSTILSTSIVAILNEFGKKNTTKTVKDLKKHATIDQYVHPGRTIYKQLVSIPAYNIDVLEDDPLAEEEEEDTEVEIVEIELDAQSLYEKINRIRKALKTYEFYYAAFNKVQKAVIHEEGYPLRKISYSDIRDQLANFLSDLNNALAENKFERLRMIPRSSFGIRKTPQTIKISLKEKKGNPFHIKSVKVSATNGCDEYAALTGLKKLRSADKQYIMPWLARIDEINNDVTAQRTKPWLEFTLEYFHPKMVVDYGTDLSDMTADQKSALSCLLEKEMGIGGGKVLDSLLDSILSAADLLSYEQAKKGCKDTSEIKTESIQAQKDREFLENASYAEYRAVEMIKRLEKKHYKVLIDKYTKRYLEVFENNYTVNTSNTIKKNPTEKDVLKWLEKHKANSSLADEFPANSLVGIPVKAALENFAYNQALAEFNRNNETWDFYSNSPWLYDAQQAANEERSKEKTITDVIKDSYEQLTEVEDFYDFIGIFGVCGVSKLSGLGIKCLSGGVGLDDFYDEALMAIFRSMKVDTFEYMFSSVPANIKSKLDQTIKKEFGSSVSLTKLLGFTKKQNPSANLMFVAGDTLAEIDRVVEVMEKQPVYSQAPDSIKDQYKWAKAPNHPGWFWGNAHTGNPSAAGSVSFDGPMQNKYYDYSRKSYKPVPPLQETESMAVENPDKKQQIKTKRKFKRLIRKKIRERDKAKLDAAKDRFRNFFSKEGMQERIGDASVTTTTEQRETIDELTWEAAKPSEPVLDLDSEKHFTEEELSDAYKSWRKHRNDRGTTRSDKLREKWYEYAILFDKGLKIGAFGTWWQTKIKDMKSEGGYGNVEQSYDFLEREINVKREEANQAYLSELDAWKESKSEYTTKEDIVHEETKELTEKEKRQSKWAGTGDVIEERLAAKRSVLGTDEYEQALKDYKETNLGVKVNKLVSAVVAETIETFIDVMPADNLWDFLRQFPIPDMVLNVLEGMLRPCPHEPLMFPAPSKFLNTLNVDVCDPTLQITWPKLVVPSLDWKEQLKERFRNEIREELIELYGETLLTIVKKIYDLLEGALCKSLEAIGGLTEGLIDGDGLTDSWNEAVAEAFCDGDKNKAKKLNEQFFKDKADVMANIIGGVASTQEILEFFAYPDNQDSTLIQDTSDAIDQLGDEETAQYGTPTALSNAFANVASSLSPSDRTRIRNLLEEGIPNLPISEAICLTEDQILAWNELRESLLSQKGLGPDAARAQVNALNALTKEALGELLGIEAELQNGGPFVGPGQDYYGDDDEDPPSDPDKDPADRIGGGVDDVYEQDPPCIDTRPKHKKPDDLEKTDEEQELANTADTMLKFVKNSYYGKGGIFNEVLKDREDKNLSGHSMRVSNRFLWANWANTPEERQKKYDDGGWALKLVMDTAGTEDDGVKHIGTFPQTVAGKLREDLIGTDFYINMDSYYYEKPVPPNPLFGKPTSRPSIAAPRVTLNLKYVMGDLNKTNNNLSLSYVNDQTENKSRRRRGYFGYNVNTTFHPKESKDFSYYSSIATTYKPEGSYSKEYSTIISVEPSTEEKELMESVGFLYGKENFKNIRKSLFNQIINHKHAGPFGSNNYDKAYESAFNKIANGIKERSATTPNGDIPYGFKFGYVPDDLDEDDFDNYLGPNDEEYTYQEEERILGKYGSERIVVLDPEIYGGRYSNPPFWVRPMPQDGWLDASEAVFGGTEGCEPKSRGAISFEDIQKRVKNVKDSITPDPLLSQDQDCVSRRPFNHLVMPETHAGIEGVVRTTVRTYACEEFLKGLGVFGYFLYTENNYDSTIAGLIMNRMKTTMMDLGNARSTRKIKIKRRNYWYTFLEQCVQVYSRMVEIDGIVPPPPAQKALDDIGDLQLNYIYLTKKIRREYFNKDYKWTPMTEDPFYEKDNPASYNITDVKKLYHDAIAYRIYGDDLFKTDGQTELDLNNKRFYSLKKMRFFIKIFAIRIVEQQCKTILMELIKSELRIAAKRFNIAARTPAYYTNLDKALLGFNNIFRNSSLKLGTIEENSKGTVPTVAPDNSMTHGEENNSVWLIEKYIRVVDRKNDESVPLYIKNRDDQFRGVMPEASFEVFLKSIPEEFLTKQDGATLMLSDCFGDLEFTYEESIKKVFEYMFSNSSNLPQGNFMSQEKMLKKLYSLNSDLVRIRMAKSAHVIGSEYDDFKVKVTKEFIPQEGRSLGSEVLNPTGIKGDLGIYHGLRISIITPKGSVYKKISAQDLLNAIKNGLGSSSDISATGLASSLRDLAEVLINSRSELLNMATDLLTNLDEGMETLTDSLIDVLDNTTGAPPEEVDQSLRDLGASLGVDLGTIPSIGTWVDSSLQPISDIEDKLSYSNHSKSFLFDDGNFVIPLISSEYELKDVDIGSFQTTPLDMRCLVDKMVDDPLYTLLFEKIFCTKTILSMAASYCAFGFLSSQGFGEGERSEVDNDPGDSDLFDGKHNKKLKKFLRNRFAAFYLSNDIDGQEQDTEDESDLEIRFNNPFRGLELSMTMPKMMWFQKLRIKSNPYDANGVECADPMKDLM